MPDKRVFVCYDRVEDVHYKEILSGWNANTDFQFEFDLRSPNTPFDTTGAGAIQAALDKKMKESQYILVLIGKKSHTSKWMKWEIECAKRNNVKLKLAAVKINSTYIHPDGLPIPATSFAYSFMLEAIINALDQARNRY